MNQTILNFKKTKHFMYRQWDRAISDTLLYRVLPLVEDSDKNIKILYWFELQKLKNLPHFKHPKLGLVIKNNVLISCFWCDNQERQPEVCANRKYLSINAIRFKNE